MRITFDIPHVFQLGSHPGENVRVRALLHECLETITQLGSAKSVVPSLKRTGKTQVTFDLPSAFTLTSSPRDNALILQALLHCLCAIDTVYLGYRIGQVVPLYNSGVVYARTQVWDTIPALYARGYGDCKSLTCALIAEYKMQGIPCTPVFRWMQESTGKMNFHILVETPAGPNQYEDPSKVLGMTLHENDYFRKQA
jgi:hypothetical protein